MMISRRFALTAALLSPLRAISSSLKSKDVDRNRYDFLVHGTFLEYDQGYFFENLDFAGFADKLSWYREKYAYAGPVECSKYCLGRAGALIKSWIDRGLGLYPQSSTNKEKVDRYYVGVHPMPMPGNTVGYGGWKGCKTSSLEELYSFSTDVRHTLIHTYHDSLYVPMCWNVDNWERRIRFISMLDGREFKAALRSGTDPGNWLKTPADVYYTKGITEACAVWTLMRTWLEF